MAYENIDRTPYSYSEDPAHTAIKNEMLRHFQDGLLKAVTILDDEYIRVKQELEDLESENQIQAY